MYAKKTAEEFHIDKINKGIKLILEGKKTPKEANLSSSFERLKVLNHSIYLDLMNDYKAALYGIPELK